jgi:hypothetical protein
MQRFKDYIAAAVWQIGLGYLGLWTLVFWILAQGPVVFGRSGACRPDLAQVLFYWSCEPGTLIAYAADIANVALTVTVWAPVYLAAATVHPDAIALAAPILALHLVGLPAGLLVGIRLLLVLFDSVASVLRRRPAAAGPAGADPSARALEEMQRRARPAVRARSTFGLRGSAAVEPVPEERGGAGIRPQRR